MRLDVHYDSYNLLVTFFGDKFHTLVFLLSSLAEDLLTNIKDVNIIIYTFFHFNRNNLICAYSNDRQERQEFVLFGESYTPSVLVCSNTNSYYCYYY